jgi:hypothetical protein
LRRVEESGSTCLMHAEKIYFREFE